MGKELLNAHLGNEATSASQWVIFLTGLFVFSYTVYCYWTENNLKAIRTNLSKKQNRKILLTVLTQLKWKDHSESNNCIWVNTKSHRIALVFDEDQISYNFRNIGGPKGRFPFLFGYDTFVSMKFKKQLNILLQQHTFVKSELLVSTKTGTVNSEQ